MSSRALKTPAVMMTVSAVVCLSGLFLFFCAMLRLFGLISGPLGPVLGSAILATLGIACFSMGVRGAGWARGLLFGAVGLFIEAGLVYWGMPNWVNAGSGQDAVTLASTMVGFALALLGALLLLSSAIVGALRKSEKR